MNLDGRNGELRAHNAMHGAGNASRVAVEQMTFQLLDFLVRTNIYRQRLVEPVDGGRIKVRVALGDERAKVEVSGRGLFQDFLTKCAFGFEIFAVF